MSCMLTYDIPLNSLVLQDPLSYSFQGITQRGLSTQTSSHGEGSHGPGPHLQAQMWGVSLLFSPRLSTPISSRVIERF